MSRDRRAAGSKAPLGPTTSTSSITSSLAAGGMDIESLERANERHIDSLSDRIGLLKQATHGIRSEVESQHNVLDRMTDAMLGTRGMLGGAAEKFKVVMHNKQNRQMLTFVGGFAVLLLLLYWLVFRL